MSFGWRDVLNGLDEGLDVAKTIAAIIPGGQGVALGLGALDTVVSKANEAYGVKSLPAPIQTSLDILEGVVKAKDNGSGVRVDNNAVISLLEVVSKSTGNGLDDKIVCMVKAYINCSGQVSEDINYNLLPLPQQQVQPMPTSVPTQAQPQQVQKTVHFEHFGQPAIQMPTTQDMIEQRPSRFADDQRQFTTYGVYVNDKPKPQQISKDFDDDEDAHGHERSCKYID